RSHDLARVGIVGHQLHALGAHIQSYEQPHLLIPEKKLALPKIVCAIPDGTNARSPGRSFGPGGTDGNSTHPRGKNLAALRNTRLPVHRRALALTFSFGFRAFQP